MGGRNVLFVPFAGGWRVDLQLFDGDDEDAFGGVEGVRGWLPKVMDPKYADRVTWASTYHFLQVVADSFTDAHRRILLAGEAAHLFAPFGARGMNSGVHDAVAAAQVVRLASQAPDRASARAAVERYAQERRTAALYNRDAAGLALQHLQGRTPRMRARRFVRAALAPIWQPYGRWLDEGPYGPKSGPPVLSTKY